MKATKEDPLKSSIPRHHALKLICFVLLGCCGLAVGGRAANEPPSNRGLTDGLTEAQQNGQFSPSNARTTDGKLIPADQFFPAARCLKCHRDTHVAWSESLHRNSAREPFYKQSVDILERSRGTESMMHCESCHSPVAVFSGALLKENNKADGPHGPRPFEDEGVTCSVCHSITEARLDGTGSYTIRRPALLLLADGAPVYGDLPDSAITADVPSHRRAMMRPLLKTSEFCATCHKSAVTVPLNNYKFLRGFSAYDEWQQSAASRETVAPFYRREQRMDCRNCHMPPVKATNDLAAKNGTLSSHRWLGANTTTPLFYGQTRQAELTEQFLENSVLSVDIFALQSKATGRLIAPLSQSTQSGENRMTLRPGDEVTVDVVIFNQKAAHSFPPELRDMYEPWVEFEALDVFGMRVFHSGFIKADGTLDEGAHVYKSILLDEAARPITRHQVWLARVKAYDNAIPPGRSDVARFRFRLPEDEKTGGLNTLTLRARVHYRRFIQEYTDYVLRRGNISQLAIPIVRMTEAEVRVVREDAKGISGDKNQTQSLTPQAQSRRWNDYGIGLLEQAQYGPASEAFRQASRLDPGNPDLLINCAIAEMRTERYGPEREQLHKAALFLEAALQIAPTLARAHYYRALVLRGEGKTREAAEVLAKIALAYPCDREVQRQLGQTLYALGRVAEARTAFEAVVGIDPNDHGAYQFLAPIYLSEGLKLEAERAASLYLLWRDDPRTDVIAAQFFNAHPEWAEERILAHAHGVNSTRRPTLTGSFAAPDK
jgi:Flp pilus assembly protein TadD